MDESVIKKIELYIDAIEQLSRDLGSGIDDEKTRKLVEDNLHDAKRDLLATIQKVS